MLRVWGLEAKTHLLPFTCSLALGKLLNLTEIYFLSFFLFFSFFFFLRLIFQNKNGTNSNTYLLAFLVRVKWNNAYKTVSSLPWWATLVLQGHGVDLFTVTGSEQIPQVFISFYNMFSSISKSPLTPLPSHIHSFGYPEYLVSQFPIYMLLYNRCT